MAGSTFGAIGLGLVSAATWGSGDFCGGVAGKRASPYAVVVSSQIIGLAAITLGAIVLQQPIPPPGHLIGGAVAGVIGLVGLLSLYVALANGQMGLTAPVSGVISTVVPVIVGVFTLGLPGTLTIIGFALAVISVWLIAQTKAESVRLRTLLLPTIAGVCFGVFYVLIAHFNTVSALWPLVAARCGSLAAMLIFTRLTHQPIFVPRNLVPLTALCGILDASGNVFFALAALTGRLDVAAVLASLFPAATIFLARVILKEKFSRTQVIGIGAALVAIALISWP